VLHPVHERYTQCYTRGYERCTPVGMRRVHPWVWERYTRGYGRGTPCGIHPVGMRDVHPVVYTPLGMVVGVPLLVYPVPWWYPSNPSWYIHSYTPRVHHAQLPLMTDAADPGYGLR